MKYIATLLAALLCLFAPPAQTREAATQPASRRLNVLFISVDDLNTDLGCYGDAQVKSPNIDRLAGRGVKFERAYCQYPLCNPSRASFLSGRRPETTGIFELRTPPRQKMPDAVFLPQLFRQHGYFTARFGKIYHGGHDDKLSWDLSDEAAITDPQELDANRRRYERPPNERSPEWTRLDAPDEQTRDGRSVRRIARLMEEKSKAGQPFFLAAGLNKPHLPWSAPKKYFDLYPPARIRLPAEPPVRGIPSIALMTELFGTPQPKSRAEAIAAYYAGISFMDAQVGVLLATLDRLRLWDNTVVVLFSDHGFHLGDHDGLWAKLTLFERSARVPLIIAAPGNKQAGKTSRRTVELIDVYPTLAEVCGLPAPRGLEGQSLKPLLERPTAAWSRAAFTMVLHDGVTGKSVRTERWRYTEWDEGRRGVELYDEQRDPREYQNLAADPQYEKIVAEMRRLLRQPRTTQGGRR